MIIFGTFIEFLFLLTKESRILEEEGRASLYMGSTNREHKNKEFESITFLPHLKYMSVGLMNIKEESSTCTVTRREEKDLHVTDKT